MIPRQVGDFLSGTTDESIAERIAARIGKQSKFHHVENGKDIKQFKDLIATSSTLCIERMLKTRGWDKESSEDIQSPPCQQIALLGFTKKAASKRTGWNATSLNGK